MRNKQEGRSNYNSKAPDEQNKVNKGIARGDAAKLIGANRTMRRIAAARKRKSS